MRVRNDPPVHLTYCLNVHPGETWAENLEAIRTHALAVKARVCPDEPFGLGLRLSDAASRELVEGDALTEFRNFLETNGLYAFTVNGFPFGRFHGKEVKEKVYQPGWSTPERRDYTIRLADILSALLPEGVSGSISTSPLAYRTAVDNEEMLHEMANNLLDAAAHCHRLRERTGREVCIGIEPEPDCFLEQTDEIVAFLDMLTSFRGPAYLQEALGLNEEDAQASVQRHVGVCYDTAHAAMAFEDPAACLSRLASRGLHVCKVQLSAAIECEATEAARLRLKGFQDAVYLHQVRMRGKGRPKRWADLPDALADSKDIDEAETWRTHFHVPLFWPGDDVLRSTREQLTGEVGELLRGGLCEHLEIETYTMNVLPPDLRPRDIAEAIAREFDWVRRNVLRR